MSQVTNLAFFRPRRGQSEALGAALAALVEPTRLEAGCVNYDLDRSMMPMSGLFTRTGALHSDPRWRDVHAPCGGTAQMGQGELSIVDAKLRVDGLSNLRIADGSIVPRITTGNSHAPCVIIGERMAEILKD